MGTPQPAVPTLKTIVAEGHQVVEVWTQPDRRSGRGKKMTPPPVKVCAEEYGFPVFQPERVRPKVVRERFASIEADVAVVVAYGQILTKTYLNAFRYGCINVHFSLLPKYRGAAPVNWAIANGESKTGVTTMRMDRGLDTGDILLVEETEIKRGENSIELMERLSEVGAKLLARTLVNIESIVPRPQNDMESSYAPLFDKSDGLIDWSMDAHEIHNRIRGFQPFPGCYSFLPDGSRVKLFDSDYLNENAMAEPGLVYRIEDGWPHISCGTGTLVVKELQFAGKPKRSAEELTRTEVVKTGLRFGDE